MSKIFGAAKNVSDKPDLTGFEVKIFLFSPPAVLRALGVRDCIPGSQNWYAAVLKFSIGGP